MPQLVTAMKGGNGGFTVVVPRIEVLSDPETKALEVKGRAMLIALRRAKRGSSDVPALLGRFRVFRAAHPTVARGLLGESLFRATVARFDL